MSAGNPTSEILHPTTFMIDPIFSQFLNHGGGDVQKERSNSNSSSRSDVLRYKIRSNSKQAEMASYYSCHGFVIAPFPVSLLPSVPLTVGQDRRLASYRRKCPPTWKSLRQCSVPQAKRPIHMILFELMTSNLTDGGCSRLHLQETFTEEQAGRS